MKVYFDSSALIKRVILEPESAALVREIRAHVEVGDLLCTSELGVVEVTRSIRSRKQSENPASWSVLSETALSGVNTLDLDEPTLSLARRIGPGTLRTLDAMHLATAVLLDADLIISYDSLMLQVAEEFGFTTKDPR